MAVLRAKARVEIRFDIEIPLMSGDKTGHNYWWLRISAIRNQRCDALLTPFSKAYGLLEGALMLTCDSTMRDIRQICETAQQICLKTIQ